MDLWNTSHRLVLCAELLERRWLLSAPMPAAVDVDSSDLPDAVLVALEAQFPGAQPLEAEFHPADGNYEIDAKLNGQIFETTIAAAADPTAEQAPPDPQPPATLPDPIEGTANSPQPPTTDAAGPIQVLHLAPDAQDDDSVDIPASKLPANILAELKARFPGATLSEAEAGADNGTPFFGVNVALSGASVEVKFTPDGTITSIEQPVSAKDLPAAVRAWVRQNFPAAAIEDASAVMKAETLNYDVLIAPRDGGEALDATFHVAGTQAPPAVDVEASLGTRVPAPSGGALADATESHAVQPPTILSAPDTFAPQSQHTAPRDNTPLAADSAGEKEQPLRVPERARGPQNGDSQLPSGPAAERTPSTTLIQALRTLGTAAVIPAPVARLPELIGALTDELPADLTALRRGLQDFLNDIDALEANATGMSPAHSAAVYLTLAAALVGAVELLLLESHRPRGAPAVLFGTTTITWSWMLASRRQSRH